MWLREESCQDVIRDNWVTGRGLKSNMATIAAKLRTWNKETFGVVDKQLQDCRKLMQDLMNEEQTVEVIERMRMLDVRMDELEKRDELFWK